MRRLALLVICSSVFTPAARAQVTGWMDVGVGQGSSGTLSDRGIVSFAPDITLAGAAWDVHARARWSDWAGSLWGGRAELSARYRLLSGPVKVVPRVVASWERPPTRPGGGFALAGGELEGDAGTIAWSAGVSGGAGSDGIAAFPVGRLEGAASQRVGALSFGLGVVWTTVMGGREAGGGLPASPGTDQVRGDSAARRFPDDFADALVTVTWKDKRFEVGTGLGRRFGHDAGALSWQARATWWIQPTVGVVASVGRYPADLISGRPAGDYQTVGLRLALPGSETSAATPKPGRRPAGAVAFSIARLPDGLALLTFRLPTADRVRMMGDFTDWRAVDLAPGPSGTWTARLPLSPGRHEVNIQMDDRPWDVPPGLPVVEDGFGGRTGIFLVE